jgi:hypothetical protein
MQIYMSLGGLIASIVKSVAWPLVVLVIAFMFKNEIAALLKRIKKVSHKDTNIDFVEELAEATQSWEKPKSLVFKNSKPEIDIERLYSILAIDPSSAIVAAWVEFEKAANDVISRDNPERGTGAVPIYKVISVLLEREYIDKSDADFLNVLRQLRNKAAHGFLDNEDFKETAQRAVQVLIQVTAEIQEKAKNRQHP